MKLERLKFRLVGKFHILPLVKQLNMNLTGSFPGLLFFGDRKGELWSQRPLERDISRCLRRVYPKFCVLHHHVHHVPIR